MKVRTLVFFSLTRAKLELIKWTDVDLCLTSQPMLNLSLVLWCICQWFHDLSAQCIWRYHWLWISLYVSVTYSLSYQRPIVFGDNRLPFIGDIVISTQLHHQISKQTVIIGLQNPIQFASKEVFQDSSSDRGSEYPCFIHAIGKDGYFFRSKIRLEWIGFAENFNRLRMFFFGFLESFCRNLSTGGSSFSSCACRYFKYLEDTMNRTITER